MGSRGGGLVWGLVHFLTVLLLQGQSGEPGPKGQVSPSPSPPRLLFSLWPRTLLSPHSLQMPSYSILSHRSKESVESQDTLAPVGMRALQECRATRGFLDPED